MSAVIPFLVGAIVGLTCGYLGWWFDDTVADRRTRARQGVRHG